jgi:hypothetical protein
LFTKSKRVYVNIERNFEGHWRLLDEILRGTKDILKRFNIGIVTINRHDCSTFIIAYQIIFCANLVYSLDKILVCMYELLPQSSFLYNGVSGTLCGAQGISMLSAGFQWTAQNTCWFHVALYLYQPNNILNNFKRISFFFCIIWFSLL